MGWAGARIRTKDCENEAFMLSGLKLGKICLGWHILFLVTETSWHSREELHISQAQESCLGRGYATEPTRGSPGGQRLRVGELRGVREQANGGKFCPVTKVTERDACPTLALGPRTKGPSLWQQKARPETSQEVQHGPPCRIFLTSPAQPPGPTQGSLGRQTQVLSTPVLSVNIQWKLH